MGSWGYFNTHDWTKGYPPLVSLMTCTRVDGTYPFSNLWRGYLLKVPGGTFNAASQFSLDSFVVPVEAARWLQKEHKDKALILSGRGGLAKTELAAALLSSLRHGFHFINKVDGLKKVSWVGGEGLLFDEARLHALDIDDAKSWLDLSKNREVAGRNIDGLIPLGTPRAFSTNWGLDEFFPPGWSSPQHRNAFLRRITWVDVESSLIKARGAAAVRPAGEAGGSTSSSSSSNSNGNSSGNPSSSSDVASSKLARELLKAMAQFSPGTKRKFLDVLSSNVLAEPELPVEEEPDVFNHGTSLDDEND